MLIHIVEDDENIRQMESYALVNSGFEVDESGDGQSFFDSLKVRRPDLLILDIMLPGISGMDILKKVREDPSTASMPVIMVTARSAEIDAVRGLDCGADDYITKPFGIMEFISRIKALLRRSGAVQSDSVLTIGELTLDDERHTVSVSGTDVTLTYKEYELLKYLMLNRGIVLTRDMIMDRVWGGYYEGESRTVDMHVKTLRQKISECGAYIKTVRNVGYKIDA